MKHPSLLLLMTLAASVMIGACSSTEEVVPEPTVTTTEPPPVVMEPEKTYRFDQRYFVRNASIAKPTDVSDPLQALRIIQLNAGANDVLVVSSFDRINENGKDVGLETWFGIEFPPLKPGTYNLADAVKTSFYRFYLGEEGKRFDGRSLDGTFTISEITDTHIIGSIEAVVTGLTRSFTKDPEEFKFTVSGGFKIRIVPIEATFLKDRR